MKLTLPAETSYPIVPELAERYSPRAFDPTATLSTAEWGSLFEAARWAPSSSNGQPWHFVVAIRGTELFGSVLELLSSGNQVWANNASGLVVNAVERENDQGESSRWAEYDLGQAVGHLSAQAASMGIAVHQMGGFDRAALDELLSLPPRCGSHVVMAIGRFGPLEVLSEKLQERERNPRTRKPLAEVVSGLD